MSLKGRIRGSRKTLLGTATSVTQGQALHASDKRTSIGKGGAQGSQDEINCTVYEILQKDMDGEKVFFPYGKVMWQDPGGGYTRWPYWIQIVNSPSEIQEFYGGMKDVSETKPSALVRFTSSSRRHGFITLGGASWEIDDYSDGQSCEYDGFDM